MTTRVVLGVGGGIAAYKVCDLVRRLREFDYEVRVVPTEAALNFVGRATWEALSGQPATSSVWEDVPAVPHVAIGQQADLVLVAPATADLMARAVAGRADDMITSVLLTTKAPVVFAPAMHTEMWEHPATQANVATLRARGAIVIDPAIGRLTGPDSGPGRLAEAPALASVARSILDGGSGTADLAGREILITAGGTREPMDPVRYIGNRSSGRQGWAIASAAAARGAKVTVIAANVEFPDPAGVVVERVETAAQMHDHVMAIASNFDAVVMAAAVADFRPANPQATKIKKSDRPDEPVSLVRNADILAELGEKWSGSVRPLIVGFAAETISDQAQREGVAAEKLRKKAADLVVVNEVGPRKGFESELNRAAILDSTGVVVRTESTSKEAVANELLNLIEGRLAANPR